MRRARLGAPRRGECVCVCTHGHAWGAGAYRARGVSGGKLLQLRAGGRGLGAGAERALAEWCSGACGRRGRREREGREEEKEKRKEKRKMEKGKRKEKEKERKRKRERAIVLRRRLRPRSATRSVHVHARNEGHREMVRGWDIGVWNRE